MFPYFRKFGDCASPIFSRIIALRPSHTTTQSPAPSLIFSMAHPCNLPHSYAAADHVMIVFLQPFYLTFDRESHGVRRLGPFKSNLNWNLHSDLSS
jgi:hypothetical protein